MKIILTGSELSNICMSGREKLDALDLIINILREHEKSLDNSLSRLESLFKYFERFIIDRKISREKEMDIGKKDLEVLIGKMEGQIANYSLILREIDRQYQLIQLNKITTLNNLYAIEKEIEAS